MCISEQLQHLCLPLHLTAEARYHVLACGIHLRCGALPMHLSHRASAPPRGAVSPLHQ